MKNDKGPMKSVARLWLIVATMLACGAFCPPQALAHSRRASTGILCRVEMRRRSSSSR
ncbi:MAG: hypothetical protein MPW16_01615 [Candidatus Manganitrophus sp.]|nr:MAG: hypothetical protein MPW16_01615 [Candidatus Manganitrophus sp.]